MKRTSKRFNPTTWTEKLVPVVLGLLVLGLLATLAVILFSALGITPGW